jgi:hypothetical protein
VARENHRFAAWQAQKRAEEEQLPTPLRIS